IASRTSLLSTSSGRRGVRRPADMSVDDKDFAREALDGFFRRRGEAGKFYCAACLAQRLTRRGAVAFPAATTGLPDPRSDAPEKGQFVDPHVHHPVVHDLLDLVEHVLAEGPLTDRRPARRRGSRWHQIVV